MKAEMKKVKGKAGQGNTFWDSYQRIAVEQGVRSQNRTRKVCLYECITYLLFFYQLSDGKSDQRIFLSLTEHTKAQSS